MIDARNIAMSHDHDYGAHEHRPASTRRLSIVLSLSAAYMAAEIVGGILTNSLALLADAGHMFSDVGSLALALFATWMARRPASASSTYGYYRIEILAALVNGATLIAAAIFIAIEAYQRIGDPPDVQGTLMMAIAAGGLLVNLVGLRVLQTGREENLNIRGAWLHVLTDALGSIGALAAGLLIWAFGWDWVDPVASILIALLVLYSAWSLLKETVAVLMEQAPGHIDGDAVRAALLAVPGVQSVHDLHIWTITSGLVALSVHVGTPTTTPATPLLARMRATLHDRFGIEHTTIQVETEADVECEMPV
jgi:cobalt-zinc-cadmium efflux system protein